REVAIVLADHAADAHAHAGLDAGDVAAAEEDHREGAGVVLQCALEGRHAGPRLHPHAPHLALYQDALAVAHLGDRRAAVRAARHGSEEAVHFGGLVLDLAGPAATGAGDGGRDLRATASQVVGDDGHV